MKTKLIGMLTAFGVVAMLSTGVSAGIMDDIMKAVNQMREKGEKYFCRKGSAMSFTFSIRSGNGKLCSNKLIGALAAFSCLGNDNEGFKNSKCFNNAKGALGIEELTKEVAKEKLIEEAKKVGGTVWSKVQEMVKK